MIQIDETLVRREGLTSLISKTEINEVIKDNPLLYKCLLKRLLPENQIDILGWDVNEISNLSDESLEYAYKITRVCW